MAKKYIALIIILVFAAFLYLYKINSVPPGLNNDQVSQAYNAFSILKSGEDRYGLVYPIMFRSFGSFILPVFTYILAFGYLILGVSSVGVNIVSVIFGLLTIVVTYLIMKEYDEGRGTPQSIITVFVFSFVPWLLFFSRSASEPTLGLFLFLLGIYFLIKSLKVPGNFIWGILFVSLSTWAYYSERILAFVFIPLFVVFFRKTLFAHKKVLVLGVIIFCLIQVPNISLIKTGALTRRFDQVSYLSYPDFEKSGGALKNLPFGHGVYIAKQFLSHYVAYFSPRSLFFLPDEQNVRSMPALSVFYDWMLIPFFLGMAVFIKNKRNNFNKVITALLFTSLLPAALTVEPFYTTRVLLYLWTITIIISFGIAKLPKLIIPILFLYSLFLLYSSYFVRFKFERSGDFGGGYAELFNYINENKDKKFVIDNTRDVSICVRYSFYNRLSPHIYKQGLDKNYLQNYYSVENAGEGCLLDNIEVRPINWGKDIAENTVVVGDQLAISKEQAANYRLQSQFEIKNSFNNIVLSGYSPR